MSVVDLIFPLRGSVIPIHHGYALLAAVSRVVPSFHTAGHGKPGGVGIFPVRGARAGRGELALVSGSALRLRMALERIPEALPLAGRSLDIEGRGVVVGVPRITGLVPAATLAARMVLIKLASGRETENIPQVTPESFLASANRQLAAMEIQAELSIPVHHSGPHAGEPQRRVLRIKGKSLPGYSLLATGLSAEHSIRLQEQGIGGRRSLGCGLLLPVREAIQ